MPNTITKSSKKKRLFNYLIDLAVRFCLFLLLLEISTLVGRNKAFEIIGFILILAVYYILLEYLFGKTIGKFITNTKVVNLDGSKIDFSTSLVR